jgi:hypothetical protein
MGRRATPWQDGNLDPIIINGKGNIFTMRRNGDRGAAARPDRFDQELSEQVAIPRFRLTRVVRNGRWG